MRLDAMGFGSLNVDEFWEVSYEFLSRFGLIPGEEHVADVSWFQEVYPHLRDEGTSRGCDPGGSAANTIAALRRMGFSTGYFGCCGREDHGLLRLHELGDPDNLAVAMAPIPSGRCLAFIDRDDPGRDRALVIASNANDLAGSDGVDRASFEQASWVHMTSFVGSGPLDAQTLLARQLPGEARLSFDPGSVYCALGVDALLPIVRRTDVLFASDEELQTLTHTSAREDAVKHLLRIGVKTIVVKLGAAGICGVRPERSVRQQAIAPYVVVDRTGAGDVAAAGFLAGSLLSLPFEECLHLAAAAASRSIEGYGRTAYPDRGFLEDFIEGRR